MTVIVLGFKERSNDAVPTLVYLGNDGDDAQVAVNKSVSKGFTNWCRITNPLHIGHPMRPEELIASKSKTLVLEK